METLQKLVLELAVTGEGILDFVKDLVQTIEHPENVFQRPGCQDWCKCGKCEPMGTPEEQKCSNRVTCVTNYYMFCKLCLD